MSAAARWVGAAVALACSGCPSLADIHVGAGDAGVTDSSPSDARPSDAEAQDAARDAPHDASSCSKDPSTDPRNCGRCGHDCRGGACKAGACQPYALLTGNQGPYGVAVNDGVVYFTSADGTVEKCTADNCANTLKRMTGNQPGPRGIVTDLTNVYWVSIGFSVDGGLSGGVSTCGLAGCPGGVAMHLVTNEFGPNDVTVDPSSVYWTEQYSGFVLSCAVGGCGGVATTIASVGTEASGVAVDATSIYFAEPKTGDVVACPLDGCSGTPVPFATGQDTPSKVDVANGVLYWATNTGIFACPTSGCAGSPVVFTATTQAAAAFAHDANDLYWVLPTVAGEVARCALSDGKTPCKAVDVLKANADDPHGIAVDDTSIYWTETAGGNVIREMK